MRLSEPPGEYGLQRRQSGLEVELEAMGLHKSPSEEMMESPFPGRPAQNTWLTGGTSRREKMTLCRSNRENASGQRRVDRDNSHWLDSLALKHALELLWGALTCMMEIVRQDCAALETALKQLEVRSCGPRTRS